MDVLVVVIAGGFVTWVGMRAGKRQREKRALPPETTRVRIVEPTDG